MQSHKQVMLEHFDKEKRSTTPQQNVVEIEMPRDVIAAKLNGVGRQARIGENGKFYCGGQSCNVQGCCDGSCGIGNGCNCAACQELDIQARKLPPGFLVNRQGRACRLSR